MPKRPRKSFNPTESFVLPRHSDVYADISVNTEQQEILRDLSVAARPSLLPSSSHQQIIPQDSNVDSADLRKRFPNDSLWHKRLDKTFRASTTPSGPKNTGRRLKLDVPSPSDPCEEETSMPAPKLRKLFRKKKLFNSQVFEKVLDDTTLVDESSDCNETSSNVSRVSVASRRSSRLSQRAPLLQSGSPIQSPRETFRRWKSAVHRGESRKLSDAIAGLLKTSTSVINESDESTAASSQQGHSTIKNAEPSSPQRPPPPGRRETRSWRKSRTTRREGEESWTNSDVSSLLIPPRTKLFSTKTNRKSFGAVLDSTNSASTSEAEVSTAGSSKLAEHALAKEQTLTDGSVESPDVTKRKPLFKKTTKNRAPALTDALDPNDGDSSVEENGSATKSTVKLSSGGVSICGCESSPSPVKQKNTLFAKRRSRSFTIASAMDTDSVAEACRKPDDTSFLSKRRSQAGEDVLSPGFANHSVGTDGEQSDIVVARSEKRWAGIKGGTGDKFDKILSMDGSSSGNSTAGSEASGDVPPEEGGPTFETVPAVEEMPKEHNFVAPLSQRRPRLARLSDAGTPRVNVSVRADVRTSTPTPSRTKMVMDSRLSSIKYSRKGSPLSLHTDAESNTHSVRSSVGPLARSPAKDNHNGSSGEIQLPAKPSNLSRAEEDDRPSTVERNLSSNSNSPSKRTSVSERASGTQSPVKNTARPSSGEVQRPANLSDLSGAEEDDLPSTVERDLSSNSNRRSKRISLSERASGTPSPVKNTPRPSSGKLQRPKISDLSEEGDLPSTVERNLSSNSNRASKRISVSIRASGTQSPVKITPRPSSGKVQRPAKMSDSSEEDDDLPSTVERNLSSNSNRPSERISVSERASGTQSTVKITPRLSGKVQRPAKISDSSGEEENPTGKSDSSEEEDLPSTAERSLSMNSKASSKRTSKSIGLSKSKQLPSQNNLSSGLNDPSVKHMNLSHPRKSVSINEDWRQSGRSSRDPSGNRSRIKSPVAAASRLRLSSRKAKSHSTFDDLLDGSSESEEEAISPNQSPSPEGPPSATKRKSLNDSGVRKKMRTNQTNASADRNAETSNSKDDPFSGISLNPSDNFVTLSSKSIPRVSETPHHHTSSKKSSLIIRSQKSAAPDGDLQTVESPEQSTLENSSFRQRHSSLKAKSPVLDDVFDGASKSGENANSQTQTLSVEDLLLVLGNGGSLRNANTASDLKRNAGTNDPVSEVPRKPSRPTSSAIPDRIRRGDIRGFFQKSTPLKERVTGDSCDNLIPSDETRLTPIKKLSEAGGNTLMSQDYSLPPNEKQHCEIAPQDRPSVSGGRKDFNVENVLKMLHDRKIPKSLANPGPTTAPTRTPAKPANTPQKKQRSEKFQLILPDGKVYKQPKLLRPQKFVSDKLYKFIMKNIKHNTDFDTRVRAEQFVRRLCDTYTKVVRRKNSKNLVEDLLKDMVEIGLVSTYAEFYYFVEDFMPISFRRKAIPCITSDLAPKPTKGIYEKL